MANEHYTQEVWRVIWEAPCYMISNFGRVMRIKALRQGRIGGMPKHWFSHDGYVMVSLWQDDKGASKGFQLHRLICKAFVGPPPSIYHQVAHCNGIKTDNRPENLRWATPKENSDDRVLHGTAPEGVRNPRAKFTEAEIHEIRRQRRGYGVPMDLARKYGVTQTTIDNIMAGKTWRKLAWEDGVTPQTHCVI